MVIKCAWCGRVIEVDHNEFTESLRIDSCKSYVCNCGMPAKWIVIEEYKNRNVTNKK